MVDTGGYPQPEAPNTGGPGATSGRAWGPRRGPRGPEKTGGWYHGGAGNGRKHAGRGPGPAPTSVRRSPASGYIFRLATISIIFISLPSGPAAYISNLKLLASSQLTTEREEVFLPIMASDIVFV